jgi:hypothetical protein
MAKSIPDQLSMFEPMIFGISDSAISLRALQDGAVLLDAPDGLMIGLSGQAPVFANHSRSQASDKASPTIATSGPSGAISLSNAALQSSLEKERDHVQMDVHLPAA